MRACKHTIYINFESALYLRVLANPIIYCCFMQIAILLHDLQLHLNVINICDWLWENPPVTHKDNYLEKRN